jgi:hypothetical protein
MRKFVLKGGRDKHKSLEYRFERGKIRKFYVEPTRSQFPVFPDRAPLLLDRVFTRPFEALQVNRYVARLLRLRLSSKKMWSMKIANGS